MELKTMKMSMPDGDYDEGAMGLVDDDLVDHHLGKKRCGQADELYDQRGQQHFAPDAFVLEQLRNKPAEAELSCFGCSH